MAKRKNFKKGFFTIDSIPNIDFLYGFTPFKECKKYNRNLTEKEYKEALKKYENDLEGFLFEKKPDRVQIVKEEKKLKGQFKNKSLKVTLQDK
jgi:hypothetical protein